MRILLINPNNNSEVTQAIENSARTYAEDRFQADCVSLKQGPDFIGSYSDEAVIGCQLLELLQKNEAMYDGFIIACHLDPCLDAAKEFCKKPVIGIAESSMRMAALIGRCFSVIGSSSKTTLMKQRLIEKYGLDKFLASIQTPDGDLQKSLETQLLEAGKRAVELDAAEVLVLGCAGFCGLDKKMEEILKVPVLDGVICALIDMEGLLRYSSLKNR